MGKYVTLEKPVNPVAERLVEDALDLMRETRTNFGESGDGTTLTDPSYVDAVFYPGAVRSAFREIIQRRFREVYHIARTDPTVNDGVVFADSGINYLSHLANSCGNIFDNRIQADQINLMCRAAIIYANRVYTALDDDVKDKLNSVIQEFHAVVEIFATGSIYLPKFMQVVDIEELRF